MYRLKILGRILKRTGTYNIGSGFLLFFIICSVVIWLREPGISRLTDALWYCYTVVTTIGFGDITVTMRLSRVLSVLLSFYAMLVFAIITANVVNFYNEIIAIRRTETLSALFHRLEHLPELEPKELEEISRHVRQLHIKKN